MDLRTETRLAKRLGYVVDVGNVIKQVDIVSLFTFVMGHRSALSEAGMTVKELGELDFLFQYHRLCTFVFATELHRAEAVIAGLDLARALASATELSDNLRKRAMSQLRLQWSSLPTDEELAAIARAATAAESTGIQGRGAGARAMSRLGTAPTPFARRIERAVSVAALESDSDVARAFRRLHSILTRDDFESWEALHAKLFNSANPAKYSPTGDWRTYLHNSPNDINHVQGLMQELVFWRSAKWQQLRDRLEKDAMMRATTMLGSGNPYDVRILREPLLDDVGKEIYDGAVLIVYPLTDPPNTWRGIIDTSIQIKAEISGNTLVEKTLSDMAREPALGKQVTFTTGSGETFILDHPPDGVSINRVWYGTNHPSPAKHAQLLPNTQTEFSPAMMSAEEIRTASAYLLYAAHKAAATPLPQLPQLP